MPASSPRGSWAGSTSGSRRAVRRSTCSDGARIEFVQDAIVLENLISKYLFSQAGKEAEAKPSTQE